MSRKQTSAIAEFQAAAVEQGKTYAEYQIEESLRQQALEIGLKHRGKT